MPSRVVRAGDRRRVPWRNGGGATEIVATGPDSVPGQPVWRLSLADLGDAASEFSAFAGIDRIFTVVGDHGVTLDWGRGPESVTPWHPRPFAGENAPRCVPAGHTRAFNVMTERGAASATVEAVRLDAGSLTTRPDEVTALYVRSGAAVADSLHAAPGDCIVVRGGEINLHGTADGLIVRIRKSQSHNI